MKRHRPLNRQFLSALLSAALMAGCAGTRQGPRYVEAKDNVYVSLPAVPHEADSLLAPLGWSADRFAGELRKELRFQLNRKGVATIQDSARASARLDVLVESYDGEEYAARGQLATPAGVRVIPFHEQKRAKSEREDPTVDDIRALAETLAQGARVDPARHKKKNKEEKDTPMMWMIF